MGRAKVKKQLRVRGFTRSFGGFTTVDLDIDGERYQLVTGDQVELTVDVEVDVPPVVIEGVGGYLNVVKVKGEQFGLRGGDTVTVHHDTTVLTTPPEGARLGEPQPQEKDMFYALACRTDLVETGSTPGDAIGTTNTARALRFYSASAAMRWLVLHERALASGLSGDVPSWSIREVTEEVPEPRLTHKAI